MAKTLAPEIMTILRQFGVADESSQRTGISHMSEVEPRASTRILSFMYDRSRYFIIYDSTANDNKHYLLEQVQAIRPEATGHLIKNPHDDTATYGLRFKFKEVYLFKVISPKTRLDVELASRYPGYTRSTIQKYIKAGHVSVNGEVILQPRFDVTESDVIALTPPQALDHSAETLPIVYIDDNVIVVNKPAGILSHSKGALNDEFTVAEFFRRYTSNGLDTSRPGIVHRLDRDTSGIMIGARNDETALLLKGQFSKRTTKKEYLAIVSGVPKVLHAVIDLPIGRNPSAPSTFRVDPSGKSAVTTYEVLASDDAHSLVKLLPKTGRTHQLRVHMQYINTPILGDKVYGVKSKADNLYLHARSLEITIPVGNRQIFTAPVPLMYKAMFPGVIDG